MKTIEQMQARLKETGMDSLVTFFCTLCEQYEHSEHNREVLYDIMLSLEDAINHENELE